MGPQDKPTIRAFEQDDLLLIKLRDQDARELAGTGIGVQSILNCADVITLECNGEILAICGAFKMWDGVAEAWALTGEAV
ncbi:MAG: hypothetical protein KAR06_01255, partial [Deltaproteobacteria bacterium]|nr:hypothetical protein [Deltaproteobacteria bacterium]